MELSYWEYKSWLSNIDFTIVGSGIVGLSAGICLSERFPKAKILILEKGFLPQGASTKNAGFACFGSISEILSDLRSHSEAAVLQLIRQRFEGIQQLRKTLGNNAIGFERLGGHEIFLQEHQALFEACISKKEAINQLLNEVFQEPAFELTANSFGFSGTLPHYITHKFEGQLDTGKLMHSLLALARQKGITMLNSVTVRAFSENPKGAVHVQTDRFELQTSKLVLATNGFAAQLLEEAVKPARAQVLVTKPIKDLKIRGTFHFDEGYYYFRNVDNRILFGGGRNLDFETEETFEFGQTKVVQNELENRLQTTILPDTPFEIESRWSGIMGVGNQKSPIVKQLSNNIFCGVRLGGMGIAIGSSVGKELAGLL